MPVLIRGDLREKYGIDKIDSVKNWKNISLL